MALVDVIHYGNPILRKKCDPVSDFDRLPDIVDTMFDSMYEEEGVGLAANQIGLDMNLFVIDITHTEETEEPGVYVNIKILDTKGESQYEEGCLSIPGVQLTVTRPEEITVQFQMLDGEEKTETVNGFLARAMQHEIDHLKGIMIVDRVSSLVRMQYQQELKALERETKAIHNKNPQKNIVL